MHASQKLWVSTTTTKIARQLLWLQFIMSLVRLTFRIVNGPMHKKPVKHKKLVAKHRQFTFKQIQNKQMKNTPPNTKRTTGKK